MGKRENIIEELAMVLCHIDDRFWNDLTLTEASEYRKKTELVCIRVDRELPFVSSNYSLSQHGVYVFVSNEALNEQGYATVEPLIEENK